MLRLVLEGLSAIHSIMSSTNGMTKFSMICCFLQGCRQNIVRLAVEGV